MIAPSTVFTLPEGLEATAAPESRGLERDEVRLMVAEPGRISHATFRDLPEYLRPGDVIVVNTSGTLPAAVDGVHRGRDVVIHLALARGHLYPGGREWTVELRQTDGSGPVTDATPGDVVQLPDGVRLTLVEPSVNTHDDGTAEGVRLWRGRLALETPVPAWLARHGRPITYGYLRDRPPLSAYQTVFGVDPGSAEMPSAGRPFTDRLVTRLVTRGVVVVPVLLHTGFSSPDAGEPPQAEPFTVPESTARVVNAARAAGGRIVAVGTTVTRALESAAEEGAAKDGQPVVRPRSGWTELTLGPDRPARIVDGLVTGWHAPEASHLLLLEAVAGAELVGAAYRAALASGYRWHEFGDSCLLLPA
jgi:S-adenosylmethionine:tRNA ribosyltransferase-isomerase